MNRLKRQHLGWVVSLLIGLLVIACEEENPKDPGPGNNPGPTPQSNTDANTLNQGLVFNDAQLISGTMPSNSNLADLKINKDTINIWPGIKARIEIQNHTSIAIGSILVQIPGADSYYQAPIEEEESTDTVSVFYVDIDPDGLDLPLDGDIIISPADPNGEVIDEFDHPIHVDTPFDENVGSGPDGNGQATCKPAFVESLVWIYSTLDDVFIDAPGYPFISDYEVEGCCSNGRNTTCGFADPNEVVIVDNQYSKTDLEHVKFWDDGSGDMVYGLRKTFNDYDPEATDFCTQTPGYSFRQSGMDIIGKMSFVPANSFETFYKITIHSIDISFDEIFELGYTPRIHVNEQNPNFEYFLGCRYYVEKKSIEGQILMRVFEKNSDEWGD